MIVVTYLVCALVWGTTWFAIRHTIGEGGLPTVPAAAARFTIAAVVLASLWALGFCRPGPTRKHIKWLVLAGVFNAFGYGLVYKAEEDLPGGLAAVLFGLFPLFTAIIATVTRTEHIRRHQIIGAVIALVGIAVVFSDRMDVSATQASGVIMLVIAVFCSACYNVTIKRHAADVNPLATTAVFLLVTAVLLWAAAPLFGPVAIPLPPPPKVTVALLYLAIFGSVATFASYFYLLRRVSLMTATTLVFVQPLVAVSVDALFERDAVLAPQSYVGMAIVFVGVVVSVALGQRFRAPEPD